VVNCAWSFARLGFYDSVVMEAVAAKVLGGGQPTAYRQLASCLAGCVGCALDLPGAA
jgi:hypothetical protein